MKGVGLQPLHSRLVFSHILNNFMFSLAIMTQTYELHQAEKRPI